MVVDVPEKHVILCQQCSDFKAKHNCMRCSKAICLKCRRFDHWVGKTEEHCITCSQYLSDFYNGRIVFPKQKRKIHFFLIPRGCNIQ